MLTYVQPYKTDFVHSSEQLKDPSLLKQDVCYVNGAWVPAKSGTKFGVTGNVTRTVLIPSMLAHVLT